MVMVLICLMFSCSNELDLTMPAPNGPVIYGLLEPDDSLYQIRVQKTFSGDINAYTMAEVYDSIYYNQLEVYLELRFNQDKHLVGVYAGQNWYGGWDMAGDLIHRVKLSPIVNAFKDPGRFNHDPYWIYQTTSEAFKIRGDVFSHNSGHTRYSGGEGFSVRVTVEHPASGIVAVAASPLVDLPNIILPRKAFRLNLYEEDSPKITWQDQGWFYDTQIQFHFIEYTDHEINRMVGWRITGINRTMMDAADRLSYIYSTEPFRESLLGHVRAEIDQDPNVVWRRFDHIDFFITASPSYVNDHLDSYAIAADHSGQAITNVTNGFGLFAVVSKNGRKGDARYEIRESKGKTRYTIRDTREQRQNAIRENL